MDWKSIVQPLVMVLVAGTILLIFVNHPQGTSDLVDSTNKLYGGTATSLKSFAS